MKTGPTDPNTIQGLNALVRANVTSTTRAGASLSTFKKLLKTQLFREHLPY